MAIHPHGVDQAGEGPSDPRQPAQCAGQLSVGRAGEEHHDDTQRADGRQSDSRLGDAVDAGVRNLPKTAQEYRYRGNDEQQIKADDAIDDHRGRGFGAMPGLFVGQQQRLDQVAADDSQRGEIEEISPEVDPQGVAESAGDIERAGLKATSARK